MSFRRRLAFTITALLAAGYFVFAAISLAVLDNTLRADMEGKLTTVARAASQIVDDNHGKPSVDSDDVQQINVLHDTDEHLAITDPAGKVIFGERTLPSPQAGSISIARVRTVHGSHYLGWVTVWRDASWIETVHRSALFTFLAAGGVLAALAFFFSGLYARAILTPVERVANLAERLEASGLSSRLNASGKDELGRLCASFDRMLERLQRSFESERRFVSDASHELRAPLSVVRAETDLALRRDRTAEEYRSALESIDRETSRLEELVDSLLQTMRRQAVAQAQTVDAADLVDGLAARMHNAAKSLAVERHVENALVLGDVQSLERIFAAVLHNALMHGGGEIYVSVDADEATVSVEIRDDGPGFSPEALEHATERFWRGDSARSRGGTGLGLSIARILVEAHGGELRLTNSERGGAIVTVTLPRSNAAVATL
jgi:signal transduction histidine kinase